MQKKEEEVKIIDPEAIINFTHSKLINNSFPIEEEIKSIQRSIALLRQNIGIIVREELTAALNGGIQG
jgi:hypothetical protein